MKPGDPVESRYAPPKAKVADVAQHPAPDPPFFAVAPWKFVVLSILTFEIYTGYWFYRNWRILKRRSTLPISPVARAIFPWFFCHALLKQIRTEEGALRIEPLLAAGPLAAAWIVLSLCGLFPGGLGWLGYLAPVALGFAQAHVTRINDKAAPGHDPNARFTVWNWVAVMLGVLAYAAFMLMPVPTDAIRLDSIL